MNKFPSLTDVVCQASSPENQDKEEECWVDHSHDGVAQSDPQLGLPLCPAPSLLSESLDVRLEDDVHKG